jgi:hypothetical protein
MRDLGPTVEAGRPVRLATRIMGSIGVINDAHAHSNRMARLISLFSPGRHRDHLKREKFRRGTISSRVRMALHAALPDR